MNKILAGLSLTLICSSLLASPIYAKGNALETHTLTVASDASWKVYNNDPASSNARKLGTAATECSILSPCPVSDPAYMAPATWIWGPGTTAATAPVEFVEYYFSRKIEVEGRVISAQMTIAADDFAEILVNGVVAGSIGSPTVYDLAYGAQTPQTFNLAPYLRHGDNTITIHLKNGLDSFSGLGCSPCTYSQNPGGVIFSGTIVTND